MFFRKKQAASFVRGAGVTVSPVGAAFRARMIAGRRASPASPG